MMLGPTLIHVTRPKSELYKTVGDDGDFPRLKQTSFPFEARVT